MVKGRREGGSTGRPRAERPLAAAVLLAWRRGAAYRGCGRRWGRSGGGMGRRLAAYGCFAAQKAVAYSSARQPARSQQHHHHAGGRGGCRRRPPSGPALRCVLLPGAAGGATSRQGACSARTQSSSRIISIVIAPRSVATTNNRRRSSSGIAVFLPDVVATCGK